MSFGIMSWSLVAAAPLTLVLGGDFRNLASVRIHGWWLFVIALVVKLALLLTHAPPTVWAQPFIFLLLIAGVLLNWRLPGVLLIAFGLLLNVVVVAANGGIMPFDPGAYVVAGRPLDDDGKPLTTTLSKPEDASGSFVWLDDRIPFPPTRQIVSLGDVALMIGGLVLVIGLSRPTRLPWASSSAVPPAASLKTETP